MKKELKDYLHLYLGCEVRTIDYYGKEWKQQLLTPQLYSELFHTGHFSYQVEFIKPILRPLSDMTEEEKVKVYLWEYANNESGELVKNDSDRDFFVVKNEHGMRCYVNLHHFSAETTRKLLKAGFDLFGLIESGLAIDKTTLIKNEI